MPKELQFSPFTGNVFDKGRSYADQGRSLPPLRGESKALSPDMQAFVSGSDLDDLDSSKGTKFVTAYAQSAWVYIAVSVLAKNIAKIPFRISRVGRGQAKKIRALRTSSRPEHRQFVRKALGETIIDDGPCVDLFNRPHPTMDANLFWEMVVTWNCLRGEFFVLPLDNNDQTVDLKSRNPRIERLITLPTELFWHMVVGYELEGWRYTGSPLLTPIPSEMLLPSEVIHSRSPNPYLYWRGMSPLIVADLACRTDYAGAQYVKGLWLNNADTGVIVTTDQQTTPEQRAAILSALRERKRKAGTADRPLFLWGNAKVEKPGLTSQDMQFLEQRKANRQEIAAIFQVPESMMGYSDDKASALSGGGQAISAERLQFVEGPVMGHCHVIECGLAPVVATFGDDLVGWFDVDSLPIMQEARRARLDTAVKAFGIGIPLNDCNVAYDLGLPKYPWGNKSFLAFNLQEVTAAGLGAGDSLPAEEEPKPAGEDDQDGEKSNPFARMGKLFASLRAQPPAADPAVRKPDVVQLWKKHIAARKAWVKQVQGKVGKVLTKFRGKTLAKLDEVHLQKTAVTKGLVDLIFNQHEFGQSLDQELNSPLRIILQAAGDELMEEVGHDDPWQYPPKGVLEYLAGRKQPIMGVGGTVRDQLNTSLEEGVTNGETHAQLAARVKAVFTSLTIGEAKRVAMTEVNIGYNTARHQAMGDAGIGYKAWLSSHGPHVRPAHADAEDMYIDDPIPLDEPFEVMGEQLMFPGDGSLGASLENIINCQCVQLAAQKKSEDEKTVGYLVCGYGPKYITKLTIE